MCKANEMRTIDQLNICPYNRVQRERGSWGSKNGEVLQQKRVRVERLSGWINVKDVCYRQVRMSGPYQGYCGGSEP